MHTLLIYRLLSLGQILLLSLISERLVLLQYCILKVWSGCFKGCREGCGRSPSFHLHQGCYFYSAQSSSVINSKMVATAIWKKKTSSFVCLKNTLAMQARCLYKTVLSFNKWLAVPPPPPYTMLNLRKLFCWSGSNVLWGEGSDRACVCFK